MATGTLPYAHDHGEALAKAISLDAIAINPDIPSSAFRDLLKDLLRKSPSARPTSAEEVGRRLLGVSTPPETSLSRRTLLFAVGSVATLIAGMVLFSRARSVPPLDTPVYVEGSAQRFENLNEALLTAPAGSTVIVRDGEHVLPTVSRINRPLRVKAAPDTRPRIRSADQVRGTILRAEAECYFEGLTFTHHMSDSARASAMIHGRAPLTFHRCRLEQLWEGERYVGSRQSVIRTFAPLEVVDSEISAIAGVAISSRLSKRNQANRILVENCAIAAHHALYLHSQNHQGTYDIEFSRSTIVALHGVLVASECHAIPTWRINQCVLEMDKFMYVFTPEDRLGKLRKSFAWKGKNNAYHARSFVRLEEASVSSKRNFSTIQGFYDLFPQATEEALYLSRKPIVLTDRQRSDGFAQWFREFPFNTARDLAIASPQALSLDPIPGVNPERVGPSGRH